MCNNVINMYQQVLVVLENIMVKFGSDKKETTEEICYGTTHFDPVSMETAETQSNQMC